LIHNSLFYPLLTNSLKLLPLNDNLSNNIKNYYKYINNHYPTDKLWNFLKQTPFIINTIVKLNPLSHASFYYIDGSSTGKAGIHGPDLHKTIQTNYSSTQQVKLTVLIYLLQTITDKPLNIVSDSAYIVGLFPATKTTLISTTHKVIKTLLSTLHQLIQTHTYPLYVTHIRAHSNRPALWCKEMILQTNLHVQCFHPLKKTNIYILMPTNYMYIIKFLFILLMISSNLVLYVLLCNVDLTCPVLILEVYVLINYDK
jgi:hypothetical protein